MDDRMLSILQERTHRYGAAIETKKSQAEFGTFVGFRIREFIVGIPAQLVHEFAPLTSWTPFAGLAYLIGITHLRGDVMALMDLLKAITGRPSEQCSWMIVLQGKGGRVAAAVSEILGIRTIGMENLLEPEQSPIHSPLVLATTSDFWFLLDEQKLGGVFES